MTGIFGILFHNESKVDSHHLMAGRAGTNRGDERKVFSALLGSAGLRAEPFGGYQAGIAQLAVYERPLALALYGNCSVGERSLSGDLGGLLRLYTQEGIAFLRRLRGEFALALWDGRTETLYLATDRFRIHPLFYYQDREKLIFASRMAAILDAPIEIERTLSSEAIVDVVASSVIPTPKTIFEKVKKLPPGSILTCRQGALALESYWDINFLSPSGRSVSELSAEVRRCFRDAIEFRLDGEKERDRIGTFLSGGIDSSTVTGVLTEVTGGPVKTFSIGFGEARFNEIDYARIAAGAFKAEYHEYFVSPKDVYDAIPVLLEGFDEPYANASAIPTYFCAKMARDHGVDLLFAGDGGDELFAGNERYATQRLFDRYYRIPGWFRDGLLKPFVFALSDATNLGLFTKGKKYIQRASIPYPHRLTSYGFFTVMPMRELFEEEFLEKLSEDYSPYSSVYSTYFKAPAQTELDKQLYVDLKLAISDNDLLKVTRMTEAAGVTVRFPFLDHQLAEFAASVPASVKMEGRRLRSFFKKAYADLLPLEIRKKTKHGFGLPIPIWLKTEKRLNEMMHDLVLSPQSLQRGYFRKKALTHLVECHQADQTSFYGTALWNLMVLELWCRRNTGPRQATK